MSEILAEWGAWSDKQQAELERVRAENTRLRAALAMSDRPCAYCSLPAEEWDKCQHGFPGCDRADDSMGCPELGARQALNQLQDELKRIIAKYSTG